MKKIRLSYADGSTYDINTTEFIKVNCKSMLDNEPFKVELITEPDPEVYKITVTYKSGQITEDIYNTSLYSKSLIMDIYYTCLHKILHINSTITIIKLEKL